MMNGIPPIDTSTITRLPRQRTRTLYQLALIRTTWSSHTAREQAAALGVSLGRVNQLRAQLLQRGLVDLYARRGRRFWTSEEADRLQTLLEDGCSVARSAEVLRRTPSAIYSAVRFHSPHETIDGIRDQPWAAVRSRRQVAALFGVSSWTVGRWIDHGWLVARRNAYSRARAQTYQRQYLITDTALRAFLTVREAWPDYPIEQITDADWRQLAAQARPANMGVLLPDGSAWISVADYAARTRRRPEWIWVQCRTAQLVARRVAGRWQICWPQPAIMHRSDNLWP